MDALQGLDPLSRTLFLVFAAVTLTLVLLGVCVPLLFLVRALVERRRRGRRAESPAGE